MRTHRPTGKWPHVPIAVFRRRVRRALLLTLVGIPLLAVGLAFVAAADPPLGNGGGPLDHWLEAFEAAGLLAVAGWAIAIVIFGFARWIMTGQPPRA